MKLTRFLLIMAMAVNAVSVVIAAEDTALKAGTEAYVQPEAKHFHNVDTDWMNTFHHPTEGLTMGLDVRLREEYTKNLFRMDDTDGSDYHWQRYRTRWSTKWAMDDNIDFNTRLTWEFWGHCAPEPSATVDPFFSNTNYDFDEAIFDHFNIQMRNAFDLPLTLTVGRQDIILGTGWLVLEGTPGDGSRTIFFDAIRATSDLSEASKLDLIYIQQYDDEERYIKPFNHHAVQERRHLTQNQDERGAIVYLHHKLNDVHNNELYYIYKNDENSDWAKTYRSASPGADTDIHTIGTRFFGQLDASWSYTAEIAKQWGDRDGDSLRGLGANTKFTYAFHDANKSHLFFGYEYLSGDDPDTAGDEKFDTLWGDWPQFQRGGVLQSYIWTAEGALGEVANLHRFGVGHSFMPAERWTMVSQYNLFWADENPGSQLPWTSPQYSDSGKFRGHMLSGIATYRCCKNFSTHFMVDYFIPGGYYDDATNDDAFYARGNLGYNNANPQAPRNAHPHQHQQLHHRLSPGDGICPRNDRDHGRDGRGQIHHARCPGTLPGRPGGPEISAPGLRAGRDHRQLRYRCHTPGHCLA